MRTIALTLLLAAAVAAQQPNTPAIPQLATKPTPKTFAPLKTAERMALTDLHAKQAEIGKQIQQIMSEACADRGIARERCQMAPTGEFFELPEPPKPAAKEAAK